MSQLSLSKARKAGFDSVLRADAKLYFFKDKETGIERNTGIVANSEEEALSRIKRPPKSRAVLAGSRAMTESEQKAAAAGRWVRGRLNGDPPSKDNKRGYGPARSSKKSDSDSYCRGLKAAKGHHD